MVYHKFEGSQESKYVGNEVTLTCNIGNKILILIRLPLFTSSKFKSDKMKIRKVDDEL